MIKSGDIRWIDAARIGGRAIGVWLIFMFLGLIFARKIGAGLKRFKETNTIVVMSFALALLVAGIFEKSGLAMIIGAYITGLSLSRTDLTYLIQANLSVLYRFFVPVFFCVMGMLIDIRVVLDGGILIFALVYALLAATGKLFGCGLPALAFNFNLRGAGKIGAGMIMRGEVALIIAGIGLSSGILPSEAFSAAVLMTFLTILIAPRSSPGPWMRKARFCENPPPKSRGSGGSITSSPTGRRANSSWPGSSPPSATRASSSTSSTSAATFTASGATRVSSRWSSFRKRSSSPAGKRTPPSSIPSSTRPWPNSSG
jgi:Kef-type K+ transport system membrane component KefB